MRPLQDYRDVKMVIGECELFGIHQHHLRKRASEFGNDFLGRTLPACLFQAADYVQAQRERRTLIAAMKPLYEHYDALVTTGIGPAPVLAPHSTLEFWKKPNVTTPFNVTGGPALALCCGFSSSGLPLGMQIAGRPFDEATVLKIGHAYERKTAWRARRPTVVQQSAPPPPPHERPVKSKVDPATRQFAVAAARNAALDLNEQQLDQVCEAAPFALALAQRLHRSRSRLEEPASVFFVPSPEKS